MKNARKIAGVLLALIMALAMTTTAFAEAEGPLTGGSITITNAVDSQTYNAYQILYLESYNEAAGTYAYKANSAWKEWLATQTSFVAIDEQGYVTWVENADPAAFAKAAQSQLAGKYADGTITASATNKTINNLKLGYYLVDTTMGALCSLDTTNPGAEITEKNEAPTIDKEVQEDSSGNWGKENTAQIGDTVNFKTTVHAKKGALKYIVHDKMSAGLTFSGVSKVTAEETVLTTGTHYDVVTENLGDDCTFHVVFTQTYLDTISAATNIVIEYSAILNERAVISTDANTNDTRLEYGNKNFTEWDRTRTYAFKFELYKTDSKDILLDGATFKLYDAATGGNEIKLVAVAEATPNTYRVATGAQAESAVEKIVAANGRANIEGLDANTIYYLEEVDAPAGYNKLAARVAVSIENSNLAGNALNGTYQNGGVHVVNNAGTELPSTGGVGTTLFYVIGGAMVLAAVVLLVAKKRAGESK